MNYSRRPNRPDGNVYRDMRRQGMRRSIGPGAAMNPKVLIALAAAVVVLVAWLMWK